MNLSSESANVSRIVTDLNKLLEKKTQKKVNTLLSFTMKAISRDQEKNFLISKLQNDIRRNSELLSLLEIENEVKEDLLNIKDKELDLLRSENQKFKRLLEQKVEKTNATVKDKSSILNSSSSNSSSSRNTNNFSVNASTTGTQLHQKREKINSVTNEKTVITSSSCKTSSNNTSININNISTHLHQKREKINGSSNDKTIALNSISKNNTNNSLINSSAINAVPIKKTLIPKTKSMLSSPVPLTPKTTKKRSLQKVKETNVTSFIYNFRKRNKQK